MIKINLVSEGRPRARKPRGGAMPEAGGGLTSEPANLLLLVLLILGLLVVGGRYWLLQREIDANATEIAAVQKEVDELKPIIAEVEQFEIRKAELEHKIGVINTLKANQRGPVHIMDQVSLAVPEMLWLTRVNAKGTTVTVNGKAFNTNAVANFIDNLDAVDGFAEPVLRQTNRSRQRTQAGAVYDFVVSFTFDPAKVSVRQDDEEEQPSAEEAAG